MDDQQWLTERFQQHRPHLRAVAYRMLGSLTDADDAVQDAWERVSRARADEVGNLKAWLTTIVARVCLNLLRSRNAQREESLEVSVPDPIVTLEGGPDPNSRSTDSVVKGSTAHRSRSFSGTGAISDSRWTQDSK